MNLGNQKPNLNAVSIFVEGSFDYAHFLPGSEKCFPLHGHTSTAELELRGDMGASGMVIDFSEAKSLLNRALSLVDHKLVVCQKYCTSEGEILVVEYQKFMFRLPVKHAFLLKGEGTSENLVKALAEGLMGKMPKNVNWIRLTITEGLRKGSSVVQERRPL